MIDIKPIGCIQQETCEKLHEKAELERRKWKRRRGIRRSRENENQKAKEYIEPAGCAANSGRMHETKYFLSAVHCGNHSRSLSIYSAVRQAAQKFRTADNARRFLHPPSRKLGSWAISYKLPK